MARDVEGLYSKRPIQFAASSEILEIPKLESVNYILHRVHMFMFSISKNRMYSMKILVCLPARLQIGF